MTVNELKKLVESRKAEREAATRAAKTAAIPGLSYLLEESKKRTEPTDSPIRYNAYQEDTVKRCTLSQKKCDSVLAQHCDNAGTAPEVLPQH